MTCSMIMVVDRVMGDGCRCVGKGFEMVAKGEFSLATMLLRVDFP